MKPKLSFRVDNSRASCSKLLNQYMQVSAELLVLYNQSIYIYFVLPHSVRRYLPSKYRRAGSSASGTVAKRRTVLQRFIVYPALPCKTCTIHPLYNHWIIMITSEHRVFCAPPYRSTLEHTAQISTSSNISR
jgi:hypothetical protein